MATPLGSTIIPSNLPYRERLLMAEADATEMLCYGTPEQHREALAAVDAIKAERRGATAKLSPVARWGAWGLETEEQARKRAVERALETSAERAARAARTAKYWDWVSAEMGRQAKLTAREFMAERRAAR